MARALSIGLAAPIEVAVPLRALEKTEVIHLGERLHVPLELTLSCMNPAEGRHCGACSKCRERQQAFEEARVEDRTDYRERRE
jgi:7-cyano-7-deazaguanine synthase